MPYGTQWPRLILGVGRSPCGTLDESLAVIEAVRDGYATLSADDSHPLLAAHLSAVKSALNEGATTIRNCQTVDSAQGTSDFAVDLGCFFAKDPERCKEEWNTARQVGNVVEGTAAYACRASVKGLRNRFDQLTRERQELEVHLRNSYNLQLPSTTPVVACR